MEVLTPRQMAVAQHLVGSKTYAEIGKSLGITQGTIHSHAKAIYKKCGVNGREELTRRYRMQFMPTANHSIDGYWVSRFEYESHSDTPQGGAAQYTKGSQINLEFIEKRKVKSKDKSEENFFTHEGHSVCSAPSGVRAFDHIFYFKVIKNIAVGIWLNGNTENAGSMHLVIRNDHRGMKGAHLGNASDFEIKSGSWVWRKVAVSHSEIFLIKQENFKQLSQLEKLFAQSTKTRDLIALRDLFVN